VNEPNRYARMASLTILSARESVGAAGMDRGEFAAYLTDVTGTAVPPEELEFWEIGGIPPGDVMLLCAAVIREAAASGFPVNAEIRGAVERIRGLPRLAPGDPVRELLRRQPE
jgi:hypothetical protein